MMLTIRNADGTAARVLRMRPADLIAHATRYERHRGAPEC